MSVNPRIKDMAKKDRPRERLVVEGADALSSEELLAILLRTGRMGFSVIDIARQLLTRFQSLERLGRASIEDLCVVKGVGRDKAVTLKAAFTLAQRMARECQLESPLLDTPGRVADLLREENRLYDVERFQVLLLNTRRRLIRVERLSQGTLDTVLVHPRDVFTRAIAANASALILAHNHPSGDPAPSQEDLHITRRLVETGKIVGIRALDHVIIGDCRYFSFADQGLL